VSALGPEHAYVGEPAYDRVTAGNGSIPTHGRFGRFPSRRSWNANGIMRRLFPGRLMKGTDDRLCPGGALGIPDPELNDNLTW
jgi:hypothetical protein